MVKNKKLLIAGIIGAVSITGAYLYLQVSKILSYTLNFKGIRNVTFDKTSVKFQIFYEYLNKANIDITLAQQEYEIFINGQYLTTMTNFAPNILKGGSPSEIVINVNLTADDFKKVKLNLAQVLLRPSSVEIKTVMKWKVKYGFLKFPVTYPYIVSLKEVLGWYIPAVRKNK
jgi:hypothetical protein